MIRKAGHLPASSNGQPLFPLSRGNLIPPRPSSRVRCFRLPVARNANLRSYEVLRRQYGRRGKSLMMPAGRCRCPIDAGLAGLIAPLHVASVGVCFLVTKSRAGPTLPPQEIVESQPGFPPAGDQPTGGTFRRLSRNGRSRNCRRNSYVYACGIKACGFSREVHGPLLVTG